MDPEWRNYLRSGVLRHGTLAGLRRVGSAVATKFYRQVKTPTGPPEYLRLPLLPDLDPSFSRATLRGWPGAGGGGPTGWRPGCTSEEMGAWARTYSGLYRDFLLDRPARSPDPEETWTLHQFGWLFIIALSEGEHAEAGVVREAIHAWIERLGSRVDHPAWRSFSISERIANWAYLLRLLGPAAFPEGSAASLARQATHLAEHLECYGDGRTNNHLINNGRALYIAGCHLGHDGFRDIGRQVLIQEMDRQFTAEGFLDEGSSHYQLIFTRAYLDVLSIASTNGDASLIERLRGPVSAALRACAHFFDAEAPRGWTIPLVGDISPDPPPGVFDPSMRFWEMAHQAARGEPVDFTSPWYAQKSGDRAETRAAAWSCHPASGQFRFDGNGYRVWWHARRSGLHRRHAHNDWGSFQLHAGGDPVLIDPGRETYLADGAVHDGRKTLAQNSVLVDGLEQAVILRRDLFLPEYLADGAEASWEGGADRGSIAFQFHCYRRLRRPVVHGRTFALSPAGIEITDHFAGEGRHRARLAFHLHPEVTCRVDEDRLQLRGPGGRRIVLQPAPGGRVEFKTAGDPRAPGGYCSNSYGNRLETTTIFIEYQARAPLALSHRIQILERAPQ